MLRTLGLAQEHFNFVSFRVFDDKWHEDQAPFSEAVVVIEGPDGQRTRNSAIGNGPVNALDSALRSALVPYYPSARARCSWPTTRSACSTTAPGPARGCAC